MPADLIPLMTDVLRIVLATAGTFVAAYQVTLIRRSLARGQRVRLATAGLTCAVMAADRALHLGQPPSWELIPAAAIVLGFAWGSWEFHKEMPARGRDIHRRHAS